MVTVWRMELASSTTRPLYSLTHCIGGRMGPGAGVDNLKKILDAIRTRTPNPQQPCPKPLYRLRYLYPHSKRYEKQMMLNLFLSAYCSHTHLPCPSVALPVRLPDFPRSSNRDASYTKCHRASIYKYRQINGLLIPYTLLQLAHRLHVRNSVSTQDLLIRLLSHSDMLPQRDSKAGGTNRTAPHYGMLHTLLQTLDVTALNP